MKEEIKEILDITETADYKRLSVDEIIVLKDYIINLQKENRQTKLSKELYKLRNEKAIEKLKTLMPICIMPNNMLIQGTEKAKIIEEASNILQGSDKDE